MAERNQEKKRSVSKTFFIRLCPETAGINSPSQSAEESKQQMYNRDLSTSGGGQHRRGCPSQQRGGRMVSVRPDRWECSSHSRVGSATEAELRPVKAAIGPLPGCRVTQCPTAEAQRSKGNNSSTSQRSTRCPIRVGQGLGTENVQSNTRF